MELRLFKTLWGHQGTLQQAATEAIQSGFAGLEGNADLPPPQRDELLRVLNSQRLDFIQEIITAGGYVPRRNETVQQHIADACRQLQMGRVFNPCRVNIIGGCDAWTTEQSVRFLGETQEYAARIGVACSFETHRSRSLFNPWTTLAILERLPELRLTCDFSHWVVVMERQLDDEWDLVYEVAQRAFHIHARVGYAQGPQVPHPAAPEYFEALVSHQRYWEEIWIAQHARGDAVSTMTPEFGPDGYLHTRPFTGEPVADLWAINSWMGKNENVHFHDWHARMDCGRTLLECS